MTMTPAIPSPCIGICQLDPADGLCLGCLRSAGEVAAWPAASDGERLALLQVLKDRRRAAGRTSPADSRPRRRNRLPS